MTRSAFGESDFWEEMTNPGISEYRELIAMGCERIEAGDYQGALDSLERARARLPDEASAHGWLAFSLSRMGEHERAIRSWDRARQLDPELLDNEYFAFECAQSLAQIGRYEDAAEVHGHMLARGVSSHLRARVILMMGDMLVASSCDNLDDAIELFQEAVRDYPHNAGAHWRLATTLYRAGRAQEGEAELAVALRLDPQWQTFARTEERMYPVQDVHFSRALGWEYLGHREQALREWQTYLENGGSEGCWSDFAREHQLVLNRRNAPVRRR